MDIKEFIIVAVGALTIIRFVIDISGSSKDINSQQNTKIALLQERFNTIKNELEKVNKKLDNHITHISADINSIKETLIKLNK